MVYLRLGEAVLAQWRAIERQLEALDPMSREADELKLESYNLRNDYQDLIAEAAARNAWEPTSPQPMGGHEFGAEERPPETEGIGDLEVPVDRDGGLSPRLELGEGQDIAFTFG
jgi:hypothetical protein